MRGGSLDAVTNRESFEMIRQIIDTETGEAIDLSETKLLCQISLPGCGPSLTATTDNGKITFPSVDTYRIAFTREEMNTLCRATYDFAVIAERDEQTIQIIAATLPVLSGEANQWP